MLLSLVGQRLCYCRRYGSGYVTIVGRQEFCYCRG
jgi:hypothetical protein